jgi:ADP-heptose:LPS heptosyltransferase
VLLSTPSFKALREKYINSKIIVFCKKKQHRAIYENNPYIDKLISSPFLARMIPYLFHYFKWPTFYLYDYGYLTPSINYKRNATEIIAEMLGVELKDKRLQVFLTDSENDQAKLELSKYSRPVVVIHITSMTSKNQNWPLENWQRLVKEMPECTFIQLGLPHEDKVEGAVDLRGRSSFRESLALMKNATSFIGVVSSLAHATSIFDIPGVVLFGPSAPEVWGHENNINIYKGIRCAPCIDLLLHSDCPYSKLCMTGISVNEVKTALRAQLDKKRWRAIVPDKM